MSKSKQPMSESAKKFFSKPSKLSTGDKNRRFKGTAATMTHMQAMSEQSGMIRG